jgi:hypothetical protein
MAQIRIRFCAEVGQPVVTLKDRRFAGGEEAEEFVSLSLSARFPGFSAVKESIPLTEKQARELHALLAARLSGRFKCSVCAETLITAQREPHAERHPGSQVSFEGVA